MTRPNKPKAQPREASQATASKPKLPPPPRGLSPSTRRWWTAVVALFDLEPHALRVLEGACLAWDRAEEARRAVDQHGVVVEDRWGQLRSNPASCVERDQRSLFGRLVSQLGLEVPGPGR